MGLDWETPAGRRCIAGYAALGAVVVDVYRHGLHWVNAGLLAALAGVSVVGLSSLAGKKTNSEKDG